jgi:hypothetical protein
MPTQMPVCLQYLQALLVPAIAFFAVYIAYRQWLTAHERVKLDLFDRRLAAYQRLKDAIAPVTGSGKVSNLDTDHFAHAMYDMRFLFDKDMETFVSEIYHAMLDKHALDPQIERAANKKKLLEKSSALFTRITHGIYTEMPDRMEKFMRFRRGPGSFFA